jgi:hypothetical protein
VVCSSSSWVSRAVFGRGPDVSPGFRLAIDVWGLGRGREPGPTVCEKEEFDAVRDGWVLEDTEEANDPVRVCDLVVPLAARVVDDTG